MMDIRLEDVLGNRIEKADCGQVHPEWYLQMPGTETDEASAFHRPAVGVTRRGGLCGETAKADMGMDTWDALSANFRKKGGRRDNSPYVYAPDS